MPILTAGFPVGSMCLHLMHDAFGARTEELMRQLSGASERALQAASGIQSTLDSVDARVAGVSCAVGALQQQQRQLGEMGAAAMAQTANVLAAVADIDGNLHAVQMAGVRHLLLLPGRMRSTLTSPCFAVALPWHANGWTLCLLHHHVQHGGDGHALQAFCLSIWQHRSWTYGVRQTYRVMNNLRDGGKCCQA